MFKIEVEKRSAGERQVLFDAINVRGIHDRGLAETAEAFRVFGLGQMAATRVGTQDFASAGDLEPFGHGFLGFDAFRTTHKFNSIAKDVDNRFFGPQ
jgi:hypothetical protein